MRIVSQDGRFDFPYEAVAVCLSKLDKREIIVFSPDSDIRYMNTMAKYSTEEKAIKFMEMLREEYKKFREYESDYMGFAFDHPKVFQFPKDEDVEADDET